MNLFTAGLDTLSGSLNRHSLHRQRNAMRIVYDDKDPSRSGDSLQLILLHSGWHVVGKGYLCHVADPDEGREVMNSIRMGDSPAPRQVDDH